MQSELPVLQSRKCATNSPISRLLHNILHYLISSTDRLLIMILASLHWRPNDLWLKWKLQLKIMKISWCWIIRNLSPWCGSLGLNIARSEVPNRDVGFEVALFEVLALFCVPFGSNEIFRCFTIWFFTSVMPMFGSGPRFEPEPPWKWGMAPNLFALN